MEKQEEPGPFCLGCGYCLAGLGAGECPECGRGFDPAEPQTMAARSAEGKVQRGGAECVVGVICFAVVMAIGGLLGYGGPSRVGGEWVTALLASLLIVLIVMGAWMGMRAILLGNWVMATAGVVIGLCLVVFGMPVVIRLF